MGSMWGRCRARSIEARSSSEVLVIGNKLELLENACLIRIESTL